MNAKGEGHFTYNLNGTVTMRKGVGYKENGRRKILTITAETKAACIKAMAKKEREWEKEKERYGLSGENTLSDFCKLHLENQIINCELKPKSIDRREVTIKQIESHWVGRMQVQAVCMQDIENLVRDLIEEGRLSASSIEKVVDVINAAYKWGIVRDQVDKNPVEPIKRTLEKRIGKMRAKNSDEADVIILNEEEQEKFISEALRVDMKGEYIHPAGPYCVALLATGMRIGELLALRWSDIDFKTGILTVEKSRSMAKNRKTGEGEKKQCMVEGVTKNEKARKIQLSKDALNTFRLIYKSQGNPVQEAYVCVTSTGRPNTTSNVEHGCSTIFKAIGLDINGSLHTFRRTFATNAYRKGKRIKEIAAYIGDLESTTVKYYIAARQKITVDGQDIQVVSLENKE